jgi:ribosomal protein L9
MKSLPSLIATAAAALSLLLGIWLFFLGQTNQGLQNNLQKLQQEAQNQQQSFQLKQQQFQAQQEQINTAQQISQQVGPALLREMAAASIKNDKIKAILTKHGYNVELKDEPKDGKAPAASKPANP